MGKDEDDEDHVTPGEEIAIELISALREHDRLIGVMEHRTDHPYIRAATDRLIKAVRSSVGRLVETCPSNLEVMLKRYEEKRNGRQVR